MKIFEQFISFKKKAVYDQNHIPIKHYRILNIFGLKFYFNSNNASIREYYRKAISLWYIPKENELKNHLYPKRPSFWDLYIKPLFTRKPVLIFVHHIVTTMCTLKCKECCCYIPYYSKEAHIKPLTFEKFKKELDLLLQSVQSIEIYSFMGGEPLLVKDLPKMVRYAAAQTKIKFLYITTNGTIVPSAELISAMKQYKEKIKIDISNYSSTESLAERERESCIMLR